MPGGAHRVENLDQDTCQRLLGTVPFGRIASTDRGLPKIVPVHCTLRGDEIIIGTIRAHNTVRVQPGDVVAFEADTYDPTTCEGWCVGVIGPCRVIDDHAEIDELNALRFTPWTSRDGGHYFGLPLRLIYGQALTRRHDQTAGPTGRPSTALPSTASSPSGRP
ncbi:pyridoxamine 5'-phosphate oxidase family protein [Geodermatophilus sp. SYSU D01186]